MITLWTTGHDTNGTILGAISDGLQAKNIPFTLRHAREYDGIPTPSLSYGILRGMTPIYKDCEKAGIPWWNIDRGFFKPGHYDGYYRIGYRHLQPLWEHISCNGIDSAKRWDSLGLEINEWKRNRDGFILICPPTHYMASFYEVNEKLWIEEVISSIPQNLRSQIVIRRKKDPGDIKEILPQCRLVIAFNSNVGMEALLEGVPAIAQEGMIQSWNHLTPLVASKEPEEFEEGLNRELLFTKVASSQFTITEIRKGVCWNFLPVKNEIRV